MRRPNYRGEFVAQAGKFPVHVADSVARHRLFGLVIEDGQKEKQFAAGQIPE